MKSVNTLLVLFLASFLWKCSSPTQRGKPNVLFIAIDDLRPELATYGQKQVITPNIDKFASESLLFNRAYCSVPVCGASRASLLTGILPTKNRFINYRSRADEDAPDAKMLPEVFREAGYTTLANGKIFHNMKDGAERCWSEPPKSPGKSHAVSFKPETMEDTTKFGKGRIYEAAEVEESLYPDAIIAQNTINDLKRLKKEGKPFFLACGFYRPHMPFYAPQKYWDLYDRNAIDIATNRFQPKNAPEALQGSGEFKTYDFGSYEPETDEWHYMMKHGYYACTSFVDKLTGDVLNTLENLGLSENTIVVLLGDHGWHLGEHEFWGKHNTLHNALQVPLIMKVPGKTSGESTSALVSLVDIYPTLCKLAGIDLPNSVMGKNFDLLFDKPEQTFKMEIYSRFKTADAIVNDKFTYSVYENGEEMLYNLEIDPEENNNIVADPDYDAILDTMRRVLAEKQRIAASLEKND
ncbi:MAG: sulfatase [Bacteroidota bacterium]